MTTATDLNSGKDAGDENFPVASWILKPQHRAPIMAFYRFARTADDVADHETASASDKLDHLERMRATLAGETDADAPALALRRTITPLKLTAQHGFDLLEAFRRDVTKTRYADWAELMDYCRYSAMPVGRFVLDVHAEDRATWQASDALCAALQVINHLQDCGKDYRILDRVYLPADLLAAEGARLDALDAPAASPPLRAVITALARRTDALLAQAKPFAGRIVDGRLALEVALIQALAEDLNGRLKRLDPLCERVHHAKAETAAIAGRTLLIHLMRRRRVRLQVAEAA